MNEQIPFNVRAFSEALQTNFLGRFCIYRLTTDSTMNVARREIEEGAPSGTLVLAEMLLESSTSLDEAVANFGIGINVNETMSKNPKVSAIATSVADAYGKKVSRELFLANYLNILELLLQQSFAQIIKEYEKFDLLLGNTVIVAPKKAENLEDQYEATAIDINDSGFLVVETKEGERRPLFYEEVLIRLPQ